MKFTSLAVIGASAAMLLTGCNAVYNVTQPKHEEATSFLPNSGRLQKQPGKFPFQLFYMKQDTPRLPNIYFAPTDISYLRKAENWAKFDQKLAGQLGQDVQMLADHLQKKLVSEYKELNRIGKPKLVNSPKTKKCAIIETAIVAIVPTKAELNAAGLAGNLIAPGISLIVARLAAGSISVECKVTDSETGEVLAMYSATVNDQAAVLNLKQLSWYGSAKRSLERVARDTVKVFAASDYSSIKREYPVKLVTW